MRSKAAASPIIFITGTDTGVGKSVLTALLLHHLRSAGVNALAMKPFCSGGRGDVRLIQALQAEARVTDSEVNPFYFDEPLAPLAAAREHGLRIHLPNVLATIHQLASRCDRLLIEGAGGLMVPLGAGFTVLDLIAELKAKVMVVARNRLGTINHTLLTMQALATRRIATSPVVLMDAKRLDHSTRSNRKLLREWLRPQLVVALPYLGPRASRPEAIRRNVKRLKKQLVDLCHEVRAGG